MKKMLAIALLATGMVVGAQVKDENTERPVKAKNLKHRLTPEERTDLHVKQMTLDLDLTEKQQHEIKSILLTEAKERDAKRESFKNNREKGEKPSKEEMLKMKNERLDKQIEMKAKIKEILTEKQYEKWEASMQQKRNEEKNSHKDKREIFHKKRLLSDK